MNAPRADDGELVIALTTDQVKRLTPLVLFGLFLLSLTRRRRRRAR